MGVAQNPRDSPRAQRSERTCRELNGIFRSRTRSSRGVAISGAEPAAAAAAAAWTALFFRAQPGQNKTVNAI